MLMAGDKRKPALRPHSCERFACGNASSHSRGDAWCRSTPLGESVLGFSKYALAKGIMGLPAQQSWCNRGAHEYGT